MFGRLAFLIIATLVAVGQASAQDTSADLTILPKRTQATHAAMLAAARAADFDALQAIIDRQGGTTYLGFGDAATVRDFATTNSATGDGIDALAELVDLLELPYERVETDTSAIFVWPYLASIDLSTLSEADRVAAHQLVSAADLEAFVETGAWLSFRVVIEADGKWTAWVAGD